MTTTHFDQQLAERWGLSTATLERGAQRHIRLGDRLDSQRYRDLMTLYPQFSSVHTMDDGPGRFCHVNRSIPLSLETSVADISASNFLEGIHDIPGAQTLGVKCEDLVIHLGDGTGLYGRRFEGTVPVSRSLYRYFAVLPFQALG